MTLGKVFLGRIPFEQVVAENERPSSRPEGSLGRRLYFEPAFPVITLGRRHHRPGLRDQFQQQSGGLPVIFADRGGNETFHGPGQLVLFWEAELRDICPPPQGIREWVELGLRALRGTCERLGVPSDRLSIEYGDRLGVWCGDRKLAQVGIRVREGRVRHGFSLNVHREAASFRGIHPCGLVTAAPAYLMDCVERVHPEDLSLESIAAVWDQALLGEVARVREALRLSTEGGER